MQPIAIMLTGISGSGKSATADELLPKLEKMGYRARIVHFDELRKSFVPAGVDPYSADEQVRSLIYKNAAALFSLSFADGESLLIDNGISKEPTREWLKKAIPALRLVHIHCPVCVAFARETLRSLEEGKHERGRFLYLRALRSLLYHLFQRHHEFHLPGITHPFDYPQCADVHVNTLWKRPVQVADEILVRLGLVRRRSELITNTHLK